MNKHGLYSKAAEIIRGLKQERGNAEEMIAAAKRLGIKEPELQNAAPLPSGKITRDELAKHFEDRIPKLIAEQYGEQPYMLNREQRDAFRAAQNKLLRGQPLTEEEDRIYRRQSAANDHSPSIIESGESYDDDEGPAPADTMYEDYKLPYGDDYRERLLRLSRPKDPRDQLEKDLKRAQEFSGAWPEGHPSREPYVRKAAELQEKLNALPPRQSVPPYRSSHWANHPNVLAHIRLQDRKLGAGWKDVLPSAQKLAEGLGLSSTKDLASGALDVGVKRGIITPQEAASISRALMWRTPYSDMKGIEKRLLHVEELQSDWGQEGREQGFNTGEATKAYQDHIADLKDRFRQKLSWMGDEAAIDKRMNDTLVSEMAYALGEGDKHKELGKAAADERGKVPPGPYVGNTQHWTDLALKNVLREAALGDYDGIVFTPGRAQADRYGLEKHVDHLHYHPDTSTLTGNKNGSRVFSRPNVSPDDLPGLIGKDVTERLLSSENTRNIGTQNQFHELRGDDLKMGGEGMKGYYDNIVPKSVMRLAQMHDPDIKPGEPVTLPGSETREPYQGFHLPMTDKLRNGILDKGYPAFRRGGRVGFSQGGTPDDKPAGSYPEASTETGAVQLSGGVRGSSGLLQAQDETPLEGLPQNVRVPLTGEVIKAGPDPRIRSIARDYMQQAGLPYNPPTKYAKVDPQRAKRIAAAYDQMKHDPSDPLTAASYAQMIRETMAQYEAAKRAGFKAEFWNPSTQSDPYEASPRLAVEDVRKNNHMWVFPTAAGYGTGHEITEDDIRNNPMLQATGETWNGIPVTVNDIFRAVHDYYGHAKEGVGFRHDGEENAWRAHASMFSPLARLAMTTETRGQNSWLNFGPHGDKNQSARTEDTIFAPQKMGVLPHWVHYEGAEDFTRPEDISEMARHRSRLSSNVSRALNLTRSFTKDGAGAMMRLKP